MSRALLLLLLYPLPLFAASSADNVAEFSFAAALLKMLAALLFVIGLLVVFRTLLSKYAGSFIPRNLLPNHIRIVETRGIGARKSIVLVEAGGEYFLIGCTDTQITLLDKVSVIEEIEIVEEPLQLKEGLVKIFTNKNGQVSG